MGLFVKILSYLSLLFCCVRAVISPPNTVELALTTSFDNRDGNQYYVNFTVGTPGQLQTVLIDTGSSNTAIVSSNASFCKTLDCAGGTFDSSKSSTFETTKPEALRQYYVDGTYLNGDYFTDVVQMRTLGLGYSSQMVHVWKKNQPKVTLPSSFVEALVQAGVISSRLYSIYLNTLDWYGSILFGGLDTEKYEGPLTTLNFFPGADGVVDNFYLRLESVKMYPHDGPNQTVVQSAKDRTFITALDTGTPGWELPTSAYHKVLGYAGVESADGAYPGSGIDDDGFVRPCADVARGLDNTTRFEITFTGYGTNSATLNLELADLFTPLTSKDGSAMTDRFGRAMCWLRVTEKPASNVLTTSSGVMRAGYWIFDMDNGQVSLAQAKLRANSSNVVQIEAGAEGLRKAVHDLRSDTQKADIEGPKSTSMAYSISTANSTVGYATGTEAFPTATGTTRYFGHDSPKPASSALMRRSESAASAIGNACWSVAACFVVVLMLVVL
ncbi:acid protease [Aureobasidium sp. EXF-12298]|nr:acid protease [Aureobasidium sp. EXF-12298]KAI4772446.1 acid protease [Aureobasidium sp. EXF-3400]